jgi:HSP20 family protein
LGESPQGSGFIAKPGRRFQPFVFIWRVGIMANQSDEKRENTGRELQQPTRSQFLSPLEDVEHWFDEFFPRNWMQSFFRRSFPDMEPAFGGRIPKVDVIDRDQEIIVKAELPGVSKENLDVSLNENVLTIRATSQQEKKDEREQYYRRELSRGEFQRSLRLPTNVNVDQAKASFRDGILDLVIPKTEASKRQSIKIE